MRSSRNVLRSAHICHAFLSKCPVFDHACCLPPVRQTGRLAGCCVSIPPWVGIAIRAFSNRWYGYRGWLVHFGLACFFMAIPTENERDGGTRRRKGTGERGERKGRGGRRRRRGGRALLRDRISFAMFSAGSTLGLRAPDCAKEPLALWTLFIWVVMWGRFTRRGTLGYNEDLTESNLCSGKSCGRTIAPIRLVI